MPLARLNQLSDSTLHSKTKKVRQTEHAATFDVLAHVGEIDRRRSYRALGYSSVFRYCTDELGYSSSAAGRRIQTARVIRRFPEIGGLLRRHELNLTTIDQVAGILSETNKSHVLKHIRRKSEREVKAVVESYRPPMVLRDRVRSVNVRVPIAMRASVGRVGAMSAASNNAASGTCEKSNYSRRGSERRGAIDLVEGRDRRTACEKSHYSRSGTVAAESLFTGGGFSATVVEKRIHVEFLAKPEFMTKYNEAKAILSNAHSNASFETVFEAVLDYFLEHRSPERRARRRRKKAAARPPLRKAVQSRSAQAQRSRRIPPATRDHVFARDGSRCTFVGESGRRCAETEHLEIDHVKPFALGGTNAASNLRLLCRTHNRLAAEKTFGEARIARYRRAE